MLERNEGDGISKERGCPNRAAQFAGNLRDYGCDVGNRGRVQAVAARADASIRVVERREQDWQCGRFPIRRAAQHGDDSAHCGDPPGVEWSDSTAWLRGPHRLKAASTARRRRATAA